MTTLDEALDILGKLHHERSGNTSSLIGEAKDVGAFFQFIQENTRLHDGANITHVGEYRGQKLHLRRQGAQEISFFTDMFKHVPYKPDTPTDTEAKLIEALEARFKTRNIELF